MCKFPSNIPILIAICTIKRSKTYREAKRSSVQNILEYLQNECIFSELKHDDNTQEDLCKNEPGKTILFNLTNTCERCYQRGHFSIICRRQKRKKKFQQ